MAKSATSPAFGRRAKQHVVIVASGDRVRHFTIRPWVAAVSFCVTGALAAGYLGATSYLILRDDLIGASMARQARIRHDYEDRIAALRAQVDRVTSRQLLDQQVVEKKVEKLLEQQAALTSRHGRLGTLLDRAGESGVAPSAGIPVPQPSPAESRQKASLSGGLTAIENLLAPTEVAKASSPPVALAYAADETIADRSDRVFSKVTLSLKDIERDQLSRIRSLSAGASETADEIEKILAGTGVNVDAIGGPFIEPQSEPADIFDKSLDTLDTALGRLDDLRTAALDMPFGNPAEGQSITSRFGNRIDPFLGRLAMHSGIDFRASTDTAVRATGAGKVVSAGPSGGYGNMVEIDHGRGLSTRYSHMSRISVKAGDDVDVGAVLGRAGSTGRSTGVHIHYEVRRDGRAIDPMRFLVAGAKLQPYLR